MKRYFERLNPIQQATLIWLMLMLATILAALMSVYIDSGVVLLWVSVFILVIKGQLIVDYFMALRHVAKHWRILMSAYCIVVAGFIILAYLIGMRG